MEIKILFTDQPFGFIPKKNIVYRILSEKYKVVFSCEPDFVFYGPFGTEFLKYKRAIKIFIASEPTYPNFNDCDYAIGTLDLMLKDRYFKMPPYTDYGEDILWENMTASRKVSHISANRKFCNFVYSNATNGAGALKRTEFCKKLQKYKAVDCPGKVLNNMDGAALFDRYTRMRGKYESVFNEKWVQSKLAFISNYKFTIAFENVQMPGWTTEKLIHPFMSASIPIYWGAPDVGKYFNEKAFINANFKSFDAVIERIKALDEDDEAYFDMLRQPPLSEEYPIYWKNDFREFILSVIESGKIYDKNPMGFPAVSAKSYTDFCREGKIGMRKILIDAASNVGAWAQYKFKEK